MFTKLYAKIQGYVKSEEGATAIEYGLIAGGISLAILAAVFAFGEDLGGMFNSIATAMNGAAGNVSNVTG